MYVHLKQLLLPSLDIVPNRTLENCEKKTNIIKIILPAEWISIP